MGRRVQVRLAAIESEVRSHGKKLDALPGRIEKSERRLAERIVKCEKGLDRLHRTVLLGGDPEAPWQKLRGKRGKWGKRGLACARQVKSVGETWQDQGFRNLLYACRVVFGRTDGGFPSVGSLYSYCSKRGKKEELRNWMEQHRTT